jgi:hypothetical protein
MRSAWLVCLLAAGACEHEHASGMAVSVLKATSTGCYRAIGTTTPDPALGLEDCSTLVDATVVPGVDRLRFVIDYGEGVAVSPGTALVEPTVTVAFDDSVAPAPVRFDPAQHTGDRVYVLAGYDVPVIAAATMQVAVKAAADLSGESDRLAVALPDPAVHLERCAPGVSPCQLAGDGTTAAAVVAIPSRTGQPVTLRTRLDGVTRIADLMVTTTAIGGAMTSMTAPLEIPFVDRNATWQIEARWLDKLATMQVALVAPSIDVAIEECAGMAPGCHATAGVGNVHAVVTIPADAPQTAVLRSFVDNSLVSEQPVTTAITVDHVTATTVALAVPFARDNASWRLDLVWRSITRPGAPILLAIPGVTSSIGCTAPCTVTQGSQVELVIAAPKDIQASSAVFSTSTDIAAATEAILTTSTVDEATATRAWRTSLAVPAAGTTWKIQASVAGYPATTILATIGP